MNLGSLWMWLCMCVNACVPSCIVSICPAGWPAERLKLIVLSPPLWCLQGGKEPVSLPTVQTTAGRVSVCRAGAHPRAHPGLRQEGRAALQMPSWRFCQFVPSWREGSREEGKDREIGRDECRQKEVAFIPSQWLDLAILTSTSVRCEKHQNINSVCFQNLHFVHFVQHVTLSEGPQNTQSKMFTTVF